MSGIDLQDEEQNKKLKCESVAPIYTISPSIGNKYASV